MFLSTVFLLCKIVDFSAISSDYEAKESDNRLKFVDVKDSYGSIGPAYFLIFVCTIYNDGSS